MTDTPSGPRRATASLAIVVFLSCYVMLAWYFGSKITQDTPWLQLAYYFFAGILWVPGAFWIIKKIYNTSQ